MTFRHVPAFRLAFFVWQAAVYLSIAAGLIALILTYTRPMN